MGAGPGEMGKYCARARTGSPIQSVTTARPFHQFAMPSSPGIDQNGLLRMGTDVHALKGVLSNLSWKNRLHDPQS
jgi:hypothetical protein